MSSAPVAAGSVGEALASARDALDAAGVTGASLDAEVLLAEATGRSRAQLAARPEDPVSPAAARAFGAMVRRRVRREPVAYILGRRGFRKLELAVDPRVLIPRPETELLLEVALEREPATVLDVGTGSGAIALAVADELPEARVTATDTSPDALTVASANAAQLGLAGRIDFVPGSVPGGRPSFDLVLANLPYVAEADWATLQPEITRFEPREALVSGRDGLDAIRGVIGALAPARGEVAAAAVALEIGHGQGEAVTALLAEAGFAAPEVRTDLAGLERCVLAEAPT